MGKLELTNFKVFLESYRNMGLDEATLMRTGNPYDDMLRAFTSTRLDGIEAKDMLNNVDDTEMIKWMKRMFIKRDIPIISRSEMLRLLGKIKRVLVMGKDEHSRTSY